MKSTTALNKKQSNNSNLCFIIFKRHAHPGIKWLDSIWIIGKQKSIFQNAIDILAHFYEIQKWNFLSVKKISWLPGTITPGFLMCPWIVSLRFKWLLTVNLLPGKRKSKYFEIGHLPQMLNVQLSLVVANKHFMMELLAINDP
jgi:hypothetical protein